MARTMRSKSHVDVVAFALSSLLTLAVALAVAWWYGFDLRVMVARPFALPLFISMFAGAVGMPTYYILRYVRRRSL
jgi:hypothetical protein